MPVTKSAIKKLRRDRKREKINDELRKSFDRLFRMAKKQKTQKALSIAISAIDHAVKRKIIHKNRAAHLKSSLSKISKPNTKTVKPKTPKASPQKTVRTTKK